MKRLDMSGVSVVYAGEDWRHVHPPCNREMMCHLERNEKLVSWLQPVSGAVGDQIPAIKVEDGFYSISLRMMKAIWRHVRLRKGFDNVERAPYGGYKLKIPVALLAEKHRTQSRFNVSGWLVCSAFFLLFIALAGDAHHVRHPMPSQGAQGVAERVVQDRQHRPPAFPAHADHAHPSPHILPA